MKTIIMALVIMLSAFNAQSGEMYKCKGAGPFDSPVWTDTPCDAGHELENYKSTDYSKQDNSRVGHGKLTAKEANRLVRSKKIRVGMSRDDLIKSWGKPNKINTTYSATGQSEQMVYGVGNYVYIDEEGLISSMQGAEQ